MPQSPHSAEIQRCRATVMFADIIGFTDLSETSGPELAYALVTGGLKLLDGIARRYGAVVDKYLGDALMAVFGWPVAARESARAALEAGLEMQRALSEYAADARSPVPLALQIGLNTGEILAADVRGALVREFAVMGDPVNVAARLKDLAPRGAIYVGEETAAEAGTRFGFRSLSDLKLKGKEVRIHTYEVVPGASRRDASGLGDDALRIAALTGREVERAALVAAAERLLRGEGGAVLLTGESGAGKSRLLHELAESETLASARVVTLRAPPDAAALTAHLAGSDGTRPLALLVDDLQDAGPGAVAFLAETLHQAASEPLLVVLAERPGTADAPSRIEAEGTRALGPRFARISLGPLDAMASRALVDAVLGDGLVGDGTRDLVVARAGGNPFRLLTGALLAPALETEAARATGGVERTSETERRRATVLFADITGFTALTEKLDPVEAHDLVSGCLRVLDEVSRKHGASVDKYLGDCVMAVFGVPVAIEDAPRAAVNAAIEMRRRVQAYNRERGLASPLDVHVGIETGLGISGDVSGPVLREYALMGKSVNAASRLKDLAPRGRIFVGEETWRATRGDFDYRPCEPASRGEGRAPLVHHELLSQREQLHRARVGSGSTLFRNLVGRDAELRLLRERLGALRDGRGGIVAVVGDPGLGKSRLLAEIAASPEARAVRWLEGRSLSIGRTLSFHPLVDLLRGWSGFDEESDVAAATATLEKELTELFGDEAEEHFPFVATLLGLPLSEARARRVEEVRDETREKVIGHSIRALLTALARQRPLVLFFEDLHWADASSVELLDTLLRLVDEVPVLLLLATRPGFPESAGRIIGTARTHHGDRFAAVELHPLQSGDTRRLLAGLFAHGGLPVASRERIEQQAAGNPFYVEEVIRSLLEQDAIRETEAGLRATEKIHAVVIPATVQEVILSRVDRLAPERKQILQLASVIGRGFPAAVLASLVSDPSRVAGELATLVDAQLLVERSEAEGVIYAFRHPMVQEITYDAILERKREELHGAVGRVLEASQPEGTAGLHATLAYHFGRARDLARAEHHLFAAGDEAARGAASNEALHFFQEASRLYRELHGAGADPRKMVLLEKNVGMAFFNRGLLPEACRHLNRSLELMGERIPQGRFEMARRFAGTLLSVLPPLYVPLGPRRRPAATEAQREIIRVMFSRSKAQTTGDPARFLFDTMENLRRLARVDPRTVEGAGGMYASVIGIFSFGGISFGVSERFLRVAEAAVDADDVREVLLFQMMRFVHHFLAGNWSREYEIAPALLDEGLRYGQLWDLCTHLGLEAIQQLAQGRFAESQANLARIATIEDAYAYDLASSNRHGVTAFWLAERRELDAALEAVETYYTEHDEPLLNVLGLGWKAKVQVLRGELEEAAESLRVSDEIRAREGLMPPFNRGSTERSRLLLALARLERARREGDPGAERTAAREGRRAAKRALSCARRVAWQRPEVYAGVARLRWLSGDSRGAWRWWGAALDEGLRLGQRPERARTCQEIGVALRASGGAFRQRDAASFFDEARSEFRALDLRWDTARLEVAAAGGEGPP